MKIIPNKGNHKIGGTCVEIRSYGQALLLDTGLPLVKLDDTEFDRISIKQQLIKFINKLCRH